MKVLRCSLLVCAVVILLLAACGLFAPSAAQYEPPASVKPDEATAKKIEERMDKLNRLIQQFRRVGLTDPVLADIEIYYKAAKWITQQNEFYQKQAAEWTLEALDHGFIRASRIAPNDRPWYSQFGFPVVRAYRSRIDGSVQPYAVTYPTDYGKEGKKWRVEVVLHGRDSSLTEVKFLHNHNGDKAAPKDLDYVRLDIYGRGNLAYRWAGESDVSEAINNFFAVEKALRRDHLLDDSRGVLRGFSMGGAGSWHLGLHYPDHWCAITPGAGFTTTHGYIKNLPAKLPDYQEACLHIYDAVDYAENAFDVPVVAYGGEQDPQLQAARNIEAQLKKLNLSMKLLVAPRLKHQFPAEWQKKAAEERSEYVVKGRPDYPPRVRFVTYTAKYSSCYWMHILELERHYQRAAVDAEHNDNGYKIKTTNVRALQVQLPPGATRQILRLEIDGQKVEAQPYLPSETSSSLWVYLQRRGDKWREVLPERLLTEHLRRPRKTTNLQGPIDDVFMLPFLCVRGTGAPWHESTAEYAKANLERFRTEWAKYLRGDLLIKDDVEVTPQDIAGQHLILFGDPSSNSLIAQVLDGLPLTWTKDKITFAGKDYAAGEHVPVMIYPSPLSAHHYVVLNSGHTFHAADFRGTNALLYPRLGDYAILKLAADKKNDKKAPLAVEVQTAGLFDDSWHIEKQK